MVHFGFDTPTLDTASLLHGFAPGVQRALESRCSPYVVARYAFPRLGVVGILQINWLEPAPPYDGRMRGTWRSGRWAVAVGEMPAPDQMADCPIWLVVLLEVFVSQLAGGCLADD